jgi:hypothetical protein
MKRAFLVCAAVLALTLGAGLAADARTSRDTSGLPEQIAAARAGTAKYVFDLHKAKADGYRIITRMMPGMGYHFMNADITEFDPAKPPILVYEKTRRGFQLAALEWVFPEKPATPPFPGATYGEFGAACHYRDGTFVPATSELRCRRTSPETGSPFSFWHPRLVTLHVWAWYPNPDGLFNGTNPLIA